MKNYITYKVGVSIASDGYYSKIKNNEGEVVVLRNHQLQRFGPLPQEIMQGNALKVGCTVHYVEKHQNTKTYYYIDRDFYSKRKQPEIIAPGSESVPTEFKEFLKFTGPEERDAARESGYHAHIKFLCSLANIRRSGDLYIGVDNSGNILGVEKELRDKLPADIEADFRNIIRISTGSTLFESSLSFEWLDKFGQDGASHKLLHIHIPVWNGDLPLFAAGESVYVRSGAASVKLRFNDLRSYIINPEQFIRLNN